MNWWLGTVQSMARITNPWIIGSWPCVIWLSTVLLFARRSKHSEFGWKWIIIEDDEKDSYDSASDHETAICSYCTHQTPHYHLQNQHHHNLLISHWIIALGRDFCRRDFPACPKLVFIAVTTIARRHLWHVTASYKNSWNTTKTCKRIMFQLKCLTGTEIVWLLITTILYLFIYEFTVVKWQ